MNLGKKQVCALLLSALPVAHAQATSIIERVSVDTLTFPGAPSNPNGDSTQAAVSADGRYIVYESEANDLVSSDGNGFNDIFLYDRVAQTNTRISEASGGGTANGFSVFSDISDDGRYVVFSSRATDLVSGTSYPSQINHPVSGGLVQPNQIFLYDTQTDTMTLVSTQEGDATAAADNVSLRPVISDDGQFVVYESFSTDILAADTDTVKDIYRYNVQAGTTELVSVSTGSVKGTANSEEASISSDGRYVAFTSAASNLAGTVDGVVDVFVRDMDTSTTTAVTSGANNAPGLNDSQQPAISADGRYIAFESFRPDLTTDSDTNAEQDIFLFDAQAGTYTLISKTAGGSAGDGRSGHPGISADGRFISYESISTELGDVSDTNGVIDIFRFDRVTGKTTRMSSDASGAEGSALSEKARISSNGRFVVFSSVSTFVLNDTQSPALSDIYMTDSAASNDFNLDGTADLIWRNTSTGQNRQYQMNGSTISLNQPINTVRDQNWEIVGIGDFDGDAQSDILWRDSSTGWNWMYIMDGASIESSTIVNVVADTNWIVAGVGDLNADGRDDIIWFNPVTRLAWAYFMNGKNIQSQGRIGTVSGNGWEVRAVEDFNADGRDDILWRNAVSGLNWLYLMKGSTITSSQRISQLRDLNWDIVGASDMDGDGKADIVLRHARSGLNWLYTMDGSTITTSQAINQVHNTSWEIQQVSDFNDDGHADIFWRNTASGQNWMYLMDGNSITGSSAVDRTDTSWQVAN